MRPLLPLLLLCIGCPSEPASSTPDADSHADTTRDLPEDAGPDAVADVIGVEDASPDLARDSPADLEPRGGVPPINPFLLDSPWSIGHGEMYRQASTDLMAPRPRTSRSRSRTSARPSTLTSAPPPGTS